MPRWNPIPSALCREQPTDVTDTPAEAPKTNGYIFKRQVDGSPGETRYIPKVCRALPAYPKTYGLSCNLQACQHCYPETTVNPPRNYHWPSPGTCSVGRRGCKKHKMIRIRPAKDAGVPKDETRRRAARIQQAVEDKQDEKQQDKTQRLSKREASASRPIDEGCELAMSEDVVLPTDDWKIETGDIQLAILASLGLLDDYEAEDADITLNSLPRNKDLYTIRYKPNRKNMNILGSPREDKVPMLDDDVDWELVIASASPSEGSMSWTILDK